MMALAGAELVPEFHENPVEVFLEDSEVLRHAQLLSTSTRSKF